MKVVGRVVDPQGKPVPKATVNASRSAGSCSPAPVPRGAFLSRQAMGRATRRAGSGSMRPACRRPITLNSAPPHSPGYGVGWFELDPDEDQPSAEIRLMPEQVIEGRLFDVHGQPVPARWCRSRRSGASSHRPCSVRVRTSRTTWKDHSSGGAASTTDRAGRSR